MTYQTHLPYYWEYQNYELNINKMNSAVYPGVEISAESHSSGLHVILPLTTLIDRKLDVGLNAQRSSREYRIKWLNELACLTLRQNVWWNWASVSVVKLLVDCIKDIFFLMLLHSGKNNNNIPLMVYLEIFDVRDGTLRPFYPLSSVRRRIKSLARSFEKLKMGFGVMINSDNPRDKWLGCICFLSKLSV